MTGPKSIHCITPEELVALNQAQDAFTLIDVREAHEWESGLLPQAVCCSANELAQKISKIAPNLEQRIVLYCASGKRSALAVSTLAERGYQNVFSLTDGLRGWQEKSLPLEAEPSLPSDFQKRYARHFSLKSVGLSGQKKLQNAKVAIVGVGGLGCPASLYLAAAGVGRLGLIDHDTVDLSNLQRQVLYREDDIGQMKVACAEKHLRALNHNVQIDAIARRLDAANALEILAPYDIILNGCDNFATRYLVNDACYFLKKPLVDGSVLQFEGRVSVFAAHTGGPCYRCLYEAPPPPESTPNCAEAGVLGVLPGLIGTVQATETIKLILNWGTSLQGQLWLYEAGSQNVRRLTLHKNPDCPLCGKNPTLKGLRPFPESNLCRT